MCLRIRARTHACARTGNAPDVRRGCSIVALLAAQGFTRDFLDGKTSTEALLQDIHTSFSALSSTSDFVVVEGTGHTGVGSICNISNAHVAAAIGVDVVLVCLGGLGSSFDELALNRAMLKVRLCSVARRERVQCEHTAVC
jgi:hypothetical protein